MPSIELLKLELLKASTLAEGNGEQYVATELHNYSESINETENGIKTLKEFYKYACHWKGLRDVIIPNISQKDWCNRVKLLEKLAFLSLREAGYEISVVYKIINFLTKNRCVIVIL